MRLERAPFLAAAMLALLAGAYGGLVRLGWESGLPRPGFAVEHGPLMASGFLGTLIGLERAVALGRRWAYAGPLLTAVGSLAMIAGAPERLAPLLMLLGSLTLVAMSTVVLSRQRELANATMLAGAVCWVGANAVWLSGYAFFHAAPWWASFLVLTIAAERLELTRFVPTGGRARSLFVAVVVLLIAGLGVGALTSAVGARLAGAALLGLAAWLYRFDIARRTVRQQGLARFTAVCLLSGYAWLAVSGAALVATGGAYQGALYDAILHALFLGFAFSMIFGHAPIIFPAVLGVAVPFRPAFYLHLALLHVSLTLRLAGDFTEIWRLREWGGLFNAAAVLLFLANTAISVRRGLSGAAAVQAAPVEPLR